LSQLDKNLTSFEVTAKTIKKSIYNEEEKLTSCDELTKIELAKINISRFADFDANLVKKMLRGLYGESIVADVLTMYNLSDALCLTHDDIHAV
jgi:hypothetical protein